MKKISYFSVWISIIIIGITFSMFLQGCEKGTTSQRLNGDEQKLPDELKGLKVYNVSISGWSDVKVAILNGQVNSLTYPVGKTTATTIIINKDRYNEREIEVDKVLFENDEMILIKKK